MTSNRSSAKEASDRGGLRRKNGAGSIDYVNPTARSRTCQAQKKRVQNAAEHEIPSIMGCAKRKAALEWRVHCDLNRLEEARCVVAQLEERILDELESGPRPEALARWLEARRR